MTLWGLPPMRVLVSPLPYPLYSVVLGGVDVLHKFSRKFLILDIRRYLFYMDRLERYYNYVVDDMVKDTKINNLKEVTQFPFSSFLSASSPSHFPSFHLTVPIFSRYIQQRYGVRDSEIQIIWYQYKERIISIIILIN